MEENDLVLLFEKLNIETGKLNPRNIKAWFDTDCENMLRWMCSSIAEDCYLSPQEESEFSQIDNVLTSEQLNKKTKVLETEFPEIFQVDQNLFSIDVAKDTIDMLEEDMKDLNHQIQINQQLNQSLLAELSKVSAEEIQLQLEEESAEENCSKLCQQLDTINKQTYEQIQKYSGFLCNYEVAEIPVFANNIDTAEFEEKFSNTTISLNTLVNVEDVLESSSAKSVTEILPKIQNRIFHTRISQLALQMEIEGLKSSLNFLESYDINKLLPFIDQESLSMSIYVQKEQQTWMLKVIEEAAQQQAEHYVNQPMLRCLHTELYSLELKLSFLNKIKESLMKILMHFITIHGLYLQETMDICSSSQFFRSTNQYINKDVQNSNFRKEAMLKLISQFEEFSSTPIKHKFKLVGNFHTVLAVSNGSSLREISDRTTLLRNKVEKLKRQHNASFIKNNESLHNIRINAQILYDFLTCGPTLQIVIIPLSLQHLLYTVNRNLTEQTSSVKSLVQIGQKPKEHFSKNKWLHHENQLWIHFMTDGSKMLHLLDQLKSDENRSKGQNIQ